MHMENSELPLEDAYKQFFSLRSQFNIHFEDFHFFFFPLIVTEL